MDQRHLITSLACLLTFVLAFAGIQWYGPPTRTISHLDDARELAALFPSTASYAPSTSRLGYRPHPFGRPGLSIEPYVRPDLATRLAALRPTILAAAARHNRPELSGMTDTEFAEVIALLIYNEHNGWFEDEVEPIRVFTPLYQHAQVHANQSGIGSNFTVWPTNLRPSVALEILHQQVPVPGPIEYITVPIRVTGSRINPEAYASQNDLFAAITAEISQDKLAIEYLAANLERGLYRAQYEGVPVSWRTLAAWHNHGIVHPDQIRANAKAYDYVWRTSAYLLLAHHLIAQRSGQRVAGPARRPLQVAQ